VKPFVVGLTGSIGAGKSTVADLLAQRGALVIDADALGHQALADLRDEIVSRFGPAVLDGDLISRPKLARVVFSDAARRRELESIVHPHIHKLAVERIASGPSALVVLDAALLLEAGWDELCDAVVVVDAPRLQRLERLRNRSGWDEPELEAREAAQLPLTRKRERANHVIENDSSLDCLSRQVDDLIHRWGVAPAAAPEPVPSSGCTCP
jgi:dephospho-CoA kinase